MRTAAGGSLLPVLAAFFLLLGVQLAASGDTGVVYLDDTTFDKVVDGRRHVLVKLDREYPWGDEHDAYKGLAETVGRADAPQLLVAGVPLSSTPSYEVNPKLAARFGLAGVAESDLPHILLFKAGAELTKPLQYKGDLKVGKDALSKALLAWAVQETGVFVGVKGQVREMDVLAKAFMAAEAAQRPALLKEAQAAADALDTSASPDLPHYLEAYIKTMQRVLDKGDVYVATETQRLAKMAGDKAVSAAKKETFAWRLAVLSSFGAPSKDGKTEL